MNLVNDVTPFGMRCVVGGCPSLHKTDDGRYIIVGTSLEYSDLDGCIADERVAENEVAVVIPAALLDELGMRS